MMLMAGVEGEAPPSAGCSEAATPPPSAVVIVITMTAPSSLLFYVPCRLKDGGGGFRVEWWLRMRVGMKDVDVRECGAEVASCPVAAERRQRNAEDDGRYRLVKKLTPVNGEVLHENGVFRLVQRGGSYIAEPKYEILRFDLQKRTVRTQRACPLLLGQLMPVYEQFIRQFSPALNGDRSVPKLQKELVKSVVAEGILPMSGWCL